MSWPVALSMAVVCLGVVLSSIPIRGTRLLAFPDMQSMLRHVAGLLLVVLSAFFQANESNQHGTRIALERS